MPVRIFSASAATEKSLGYEDKTKTQGVQWNNHELDTHVTQKPKKVSETAIPSEIAAKP